MRELGMVLGAGLIFLVFFNAVILPGVEIRGFSNNSSCTGECYQQYVKEHGTPSHILRVKQELAATDKFSSIKPLWSGCAACHGQEGQGMAVFPKLAGQSADYITDRLNTYKNRGEVGPMSSTMWAQAGMLSSADMEMLGKYIETL